MSNQETPFARSARRHIAGGLASVVHRAKLTLGPWVRRAATDPPSSRRFEEDDGVDIDVQLEKHFTRVGTQMASEVVARTSDAVGDGTATALVLAHSIYVDGVALLDAGENPLDVQQGIDAAIAVVVRELERLSTPVVSRDQIVQVGSVSADGNRTIGNLVADAIGRVGRAGVVTVSETESPETTLEILDGMRLDCGYLSPYFVTDSQRADAVLDEPFVLVRDDKLTSIRELSPLLERVAKASKSLLIIGEVAGEALASLLASKIMGALDVCVIDPPWRANVRREMMTDTQVLLGGRVEAFGFAPSSLVIEDLGKAKTIIVSKDSTILIGCGGLRDDVQKRLEHLRLESAAAQSAEDKEAIRDRLASMEGVVATIRLARSNQEKKGGRAESALHAARAALEEGIVPGGGLALVRTLPALAKLQVPAAQQGGVDIVRRALEQPLRQIAENGGVDGTAVVNEVRCRHDGFGYNAITGAYEDLVASGVVDATKVVRVALQSAAPVASLMLTTEPLSAPPVMQHAPTPEDSNNTGLGGLTL